MKRNVRLRFHLGKGDNYQMWQLTTEQGVQYFDPHQWSFVLDDVKLVNRKSTAVKIHSGKNKTVCAWIAASSYKMFPAALFSDADVSSVNTASFNPKVKPNWIDKNELDIDGAELKRVQTINRNVYFED